MNKQEVIDRLRERSKFAKALGATSLYVYGSRARGDAEAESDLDLFVDFDPEMFGFVELIELEESLSRELGLTVQLGTRDALHPMMRETIEAEAIQVF